MIVEIHKNFQKELPRERAAQNLSPSLLYLPTTDHPAQYLRLQAFHKYWYNEKYFCIISILKNYKYAIKD